MPGDGMTNGAETTKLALPRLLVGLAQGTGLLLLNKSWEAHIWANDQWLFAVLVAWMLLVPPTILVGLGQMRIAGLITWIVGASAAVGIVARHGVVREVTANSSENFIIWPLLGVALFVAYHLYAAALIDGRVVARYRTYFDVAWKNGVQLALSLLFTGAFWLLLWLGASLFELLKIDLIFQLIRSDWFSYPATMVAFALAVHVSDVRVGLIEGARALALVLLSWLLPLMTLIAVGFLAVLPGTGLEPLWATGSATALLLASACVLVILINATYQHGEQESGPPLALRLSARIAALALAPIVAIAGYSIWLRIDQHGLTPERVIGASFVLVAALYAAGYVIAALWPGRWMKPLEFTNVLAGLAISAVVMALLTPLADPARISVDDQLRRLKSGLIAPDKFDYNFLRYEAARYGADALTALAKDRSSPLAIAIAQKAEEALKTVKGAPAAATPVEDLLAKIVVYPTGAVLPESFRKQVWSQNSVTPANCVQNAPPNAPCEAYLTDIDGNGTPEVLLYDNYRINAFRVGADNVWVWVGYYEPTMCGMTLQGLRAGHVRSVAPAINDLEIDGKRLRLQGCGP